MANTKISELTALATPDAADLVPVTDSSASQTKRTTVGGIVGIISGDVDVASDGTATISELPVSKLQDGAARQLLQTDAAGTGVEWTSNVSVASAAVSDLTSGRVVLAGTGGELEDSAGLTFNGTQLDVDGDVVITGDLTVEGASTVLETQTVTVEDKNIELGVVASPTDVTADGGGITLKGTTDKTINWIDATDAWTFSEHVNIATGKEYRIAGTKVLDATSLGSAVVNSSLTSVGTIDTGVWQGTAINGSYVVPSFGAQNITTTGTVTAAALIPTGSSIPTNGLYLPSANNVALSSAGYGRIFLDASGNIGFGSSPVVAFSGQTHLTVDHSTGGTTVAGYNLATNGTRRASLITYPGNSEALRITAEDQLLPITVHNNGGETLRTNSDKELLIGYTTDNGAYKLQVNSQIFATSSTVATSDGRYKENVATLDGCLSLIKALRPVSFDWKSQEPATRVDKDGKTIVVREAHNFPDGKQVGFIAQEVEEVLANKPWLGSVIKQNVRPAVTDADGNELAPREEFLGIAEGNLVAVLTSALKEAISEIETLKSRVTALETT